MTMDSQNQTYHATLSGRFVATCLIACCGISFSLGRFARHQLMPDLSLDIIKESKKSGDGLPTPIAKGGKIVPQTLYTTRNFDTRNSATIVSQWLQQEEGGPEDVPVPLNERLTQLNETLEEEEEFEDEEHLPAGQHLLVDMDNIDASFLNSEKQLATAMIQLVDNSGLTLLSYHCHGLSPEGVSCVGVLLESHVSFHTWPTEGVITLDLFTCGCTSLLDSVQLIEDLFAIPKTGSSESPKVLWAYKRRGFKEQSALSGSRDTFAYPLGLHGLENKREVALAEIDSGKQARVYDVPQPNHEGQLEVNRFLYLDGVFKSSLFSQTASYESFVHPAMFAHKDPKRVVLFGAGAGASVREILKHKSVEEVTVVGADRTFIEFARVTLPAWSDCSYLGEDGSNCFDDPRVTLHYENPGAWLSKYSSEEEATAFDVALVDFFDLEEEFSNKMLTSDSLFFHDLESLLADSGLAALHVPGDVRAVDSPVPTLNGVRAHHFHDRQDGIISNLKNVGFEDTKTYSENQAGFSDERNYIVAFRSAGESTLWDNNEAQVSYEIQKRTLHSQSGEALLNFFDGAAMTAYSKVSNTKLSLQKATDCSASPKPSWCGERAQLQHKVLHEANETTEGSKRTTILLPKDSDDKVDANSSSTENMECANNDENSDCAYSGSVDEQRPVAHQES